MFVVYSKGIVEITKPIEEVVETNNNKGCIRSSRRDPHYTLGKKSKVQNTTPTVTIEEMTQDIDPGQVPKENNEANKIKGHKKSFKRALQYTLDPKAKVQKTTQEGPSVQVEKEIQILDSPQ
jgi:hypothetical protein